jgi:hypothetical protein
MKGRHMDTIKSLIAVALAAVMLNGFATTVVADGAEAEAEAEVICETGSYGQNINCKAKSKAEAKVVTRHEPVNTGLDTQGVAMAVGTVTTGAAAIAAKRRLGK